MSGMFTLNGSDFWRGLVMAVTAPLFVALTAVLGSVFGAPNFDVFQVEWASLGHTLINTSIVVSYGSFTGYLVKNLFTNNQGSFLGVTPKT